MHNELITEIPGLNQFVKKKTRKVKSNMPTAPKTVFCMTVWNRSSFMFFICMLMLISVSIGNAVITPDKNKYLEWLNINASTIIVPPTTKYKK